MHDKITELLERFESMKEDLRKEYAALSEKYGFSVQKKRVIFLEEMRKRNKSFKESFIRMIFNAPIRHLLSIPFIYMMVIPGLILDIFLTFYQYTAFTLYRIPYVKRSDYFIYERRFLDYLNWFQKINCLYCSYMNGVFSYAVEIGARTERYWCPLKASSHPRHTHPWYKDFADYGNPEEWKERYTDNERAFCKIQQK